ncbi:imidazolonepropionase [Candidatus Acetothermia bacterium]|jgi:imidazolonepropionase|nr:imidazolonepropionase [Candidatus Acetothermia bacterium]MCI2431479.1 imidazolonepropionase [Candidatus Acetothermia bacterium]MCI2436441.1 imidazolonepropionase [Candidatus Acetothermia bacterium]
MLITNIGQLVTPQGIRPLRGHAMRKLTVIQSAYIQIEQGKIVRIGPMKEAPHAKNVFDAQGGVAIPGLVDPHTHAVFYGTREGEFLARCQGEKYGKGILTSVERVREASEDQIYEFSKKFLLEMMRLGTTTIEIKSGYGLDTESELKLLRVIQRLREALTPATPPLSRSDGRGVGGEGLEIVPTFCGAHAVPAGVEKSRYIREIIEEMLPRVQREALAEFGDVFCEQGFFSIDESREMLRACRVAGLGLKIHADELSPLGGAELAGELQALSADHLLHISDRGIAAMKEAGVVAVLLPGTAFSLNAAYAPARKMIEAGLAVALGTDFNPGTCLIYSMFFMMALAVLKMKMTVEEALTAATLNAAAAVRRAEKLGSLEPGKRADLVILDLENYKQIPYFIGHEGRFVRAVICAGRVGAN